MKLIPGKLYICSKYYLLLYSTSAAAASGAATGAAVAYTAGGRHSAAVGIADYWSKMLGEPVSFCEPNTILLVLDNRDNQYIEVLAGNKKGWIIYRDWLGIERLMPSSPIGDNEGQHRE